MRREPRRGVRGISGSESDGVAMFLFKNQVVIRIIVFRKRKRPRAYIFEIYL